MKTLKYKFGPLSGLRRKKVYGGGTVPANEVKSEILAALAKIESVCGVKFSTTSGVALRTFLVRNFVDFRYRAWVNNSRKEIGFNSWIGSQTENSRWGAPNQIYILALHEVLCHWMGLNHSGDKKSVRHATASTKNLTATDIKLLLKKFPIDKPKPPPAPKPPKADKELRDKMRDAAKLLKKNWKTLAEQKAAIVAAKKLL